MKRRERWHIKRKWWRKGRIGTKVFLSKSLFVRFLPFIRKLNLEKLAHHLRIDVYGGDMTERNSKQTLLFCTILELELKVWNTTMQHYALNAPATWVKNKNLGTWFEFYCHLKLEKYISFTSAKCKTLRIQYNGKDAFLVCYWNDVRYFQRGWRKSYEHHQIVSHISFPNGFWERII